jgi:1-acyl-sn-glycerol-3-phosphate acyltransferase
MPDAALPPLPGRNDFYWLRLPATGLCFLVFGLAAVSLGAIWLPIVIVASGGGVRARRRSRTAVATGLRFFLGFARFLGVLRYSLHDIEKLGVPGQVIVANHPTLIDMAFLLGFVPQVNCIVKSTLFANLVTGGAVIAAGYIRNSPVPAMIHDAEQALRAGESLVIFPEGTRTVPGKPVVFQRGAANIALRAATRLTPVFISCEPPTLSKHQPWYRIPARRPHFCVRAGPCIDVAEFRTAPLPAASRSLNSVLTELFNQANPP